MNTTSTRTHASSKGFGKAFPLVVALLSALLCVAAGACSSEEGTTPDCTQDVDGDGHNTIDNGCNPFAICIVNGEAANATQCCTNAGGGDPNTYEHQACMYGYGAGPEPGSTPE